MSLRILRTETAYRGWITVLRATVRDDTGEEHVREIAEHGRSAAVLPYDGVRRTALLARLPRAPVIHAGGPGELVEAPAGILDDEEAQACARREALEEVGVRLSALEPVARAWPAPGSSAEVIELFLAPYAAADRIGEGGGVAEEHEGISVVEAPLAELWRMFEERELADLKTITLLLALRVRRPELFAPEAA